MQCRKSCVCIPGYTLSRPLEAVAHNREGAASGPKPQKKPGRTGIQVVQAMSRPLKVDESSLPTPGE